MEVKIESLNGSLPEGSYISVKIGDVQKQTLYNPEKLYRFPQACRHGKIDIYQRVGTCEITWEAEQPETKLCKAMGTSGDTGIKLQVSMTLHVGKGLEKTDLDASFEGKPEKRRTGEKAKNYLKEHDLESLMTAAMRALLKSMPEDPVAFLCNFIGSSVDGRKPTETQANVEDLHRQLAAAETKLMESEARRSELQRKLKDIQEKACTTKPVSVLEGGSFVKYYKAHILPAVHKNMFDRVLAPRTAAAVPSEPKPPQVLGKKEAAPSPIPTSEAKAAPPDFTSNQHEVVHVQDPGTAEKSVGTMWWNMPSSGTWVMQRLDSSETEVVVPGLTCTMHDAGHVQQPSKMEQPAGGSWWHMPSSGTWVMRRLSSSARKVRQDQIKDLSVKEYRVHAQNVLLGAVSDGRLLAALEEVIAEERAKTDPGYEASTKPHDPPCGSDQVEVHKHVPSNQSAPAEQATETVNFEEIKTGIREALVSALESGQLLQEIAQIRKEYLLDPAFS